LHWNIYIEQHQARLRKRSVENDTIEMIDRRRSYKIRIQEYRRVIDWITNCGCLLNGTNRFLTIGWLVKATNIDNIIFEPNESYPSGLLEYNRTFNHHIEINVILIRYLNLKTLILNELVINLHISLIIFDFQSIN